MEFRTLKCPHCKKKGVSLVKKLLSGPAFEHRCSKCNRYWGVSHWAALASVTCVVAYIVYLALGGPVPFGSRTFATIAFTLALCILLLMVPTVKK